jgi:hypothetical protein
MTPYHPEKLTHPSQAKTSASTSTETPWDPIYLNPQHVEMLKQRVQGIPVSRIVYNFKRFGVQFSSRHIKRVIDSPKGREFASLYSAQLHAGTVGLTTVGAMYAPEALYTEVDIMRNPLSGERHRLNAAQDLMDRTGPPKISRQETENLKPTTIVLNITASQMSQFAAPPAVVEATVVPLLENPSSNNDD